MHASRVFTDVNRDPYTSEEAAKAQSLGASKGPSRGGSPKAIGLARGSVYEAPRLRKFVMASHNGTQQALPARQRTGRLRA